MQTEYLSGDHVRTEFLRLCDVSTIYTHADVKVAHRMAVILYEDMRSRAKSLYLMHPELPCQRVYLSDECSMVLRGQVDVGRVSGGAPLHKRGRTLQSFLSQRGFAKIVTPDGGIAMVPLCPPPRPMDHGKSSQFLFKACCRMRTRAGSATRTSYSIARY